jgi:integrase
MISSHTFRHPADAVAWQQKTKAALKTGRPYDHAPVPKDEFDPRATPTGRDVTLDQLSDRFIAAMHAEVALNKHGRPYKPSARRTIEQALTGRVRTELGHRPLRSVGRSDVQQLIDTLVAARLSGSRVRNVLSALRSLYTYAISHELTDTSPVERIVLPAVNETPLSRIATPHEFVLLLDALPPADALPFALAAYATARSQEILNLTWDAVDFQNDTIHLAEKDTYAKSAAAHRTVPLIPQLRQLLLTEHATREPNASEFVCPGRRTGGCFSGKLSTGALYQRADAAWQARHLTSIRLQACRHTAASWMRAAGLDLKTRSTLMGHSTTATTDHGRSSITEDRYTHLLPGELKHAATRLARFIAANTAHIQASAADHPLHRDHKHSLTKPYRATTPTTGGTRPIAYSYWRSPQPVLTVLNA